MSDVYFRMSGCLKNRETFRLAKIRNITFLVFIVMGFHAFLLMRALILTMSMHQGSTY
ncbi:MAG: hypothetical protein QW413_05770 [Nitrososphaerota archaeon]